MSNVRVLIAMLICCRVGALAAEVKIDADYPGGNIIVQRIDRDTVHLRQDLRDTKGWWFYWNFRVRGAGGRTLTFRFTNKSPIGVRGPAVSTDGGKTWAWLGSRTVKAGAKGASFRYSFPADAAAVRFCFAVPYQDADLQRFLKRHAGSKHLVVKELCKTRKGRTVERLHVGKVSGRPTCRVLLTCRHHSCEMMASYVLEGAVAAILADTDDGRWFRRNVEVMAVPFMDKDGVEDGDQGKNRKPRDHCRDYVGKSLYPSVRALRELAPKWSAGRLKIAIDLHCPYIRGKGNEAIYMVGSSNKDIWARQCALAKILESVRAGPLPYKAADNLPFGKSWNKPASYKAGKSFFQWAEELKDIRLSSAFEIPYASAAGKPVTSDSARAFGADLVRAIRRYVEAMDAPSNSNVQPQSAKPTEPPPHVTALFRKRGKGDRLLFRNHSLLWAVGAMEKVACPLFRPFDCGLPAGKRTWHQGETS
ncbi:MAG: peptidase M14 [Phycisphaerae bacterium]|nr:peptidase M14 [Phycisphaerae bacterium]